MGYADIAEDVGAGTGIEAGVDIVCGVAFEEGEGGGMGSKMVGFFTVGTKVQG